jgi:hypothetical protein
VESANIKTLAEKLAKISDHATTHGEHYPIGELYGFKLLVKTEDSMKEGLFMKENRFFIEGEGHIKYSYNNGHIANDPKLAVNYFLHALEKIPSLIEKYEKDNVKLSQDLPILQEVAKSAWKKEDELKKLKSELSALSRKIDLSLKPVDTGEDKKEERQQEKPLNPNIERLQEFKQVMGDRLVIAGIPKYETEKQTKGMKI